MKCTLNGFKIPQLLRLLLLQAYTIHQSLIKMFYAKGIPCDYFNVAIVTITSNYGILAEITVAIENAAGQRT